MVKIKKYKRSQMKIQQTAFLLVAVTFFFILVGLFVLGFRFAGLKNTSSGLEEQNAMLLVSKIANSPEFSCGDSFGTGYINCVDADKVMILKDRSEKYKSFWGASNIIIRKIYPKTSGEKECTSQNYPNCNIITVGSTTGGTSVSNFVSLCRKEALESSYYNKCELAVLMVSYQNKI